MTHGAVSAAWSRMMRGGAWLTAASVAGAPLLVVQGIVVTRALGPGGFGALAIVVAVVTTVRMLLSFRANELVVRYASMAVTARDMRMTGAVLRAAAVLEAISAMVAWGVVLGSAAWAARVFGGGLVEPRAIVLYSLVIPLGLVAESALGTLQTFHRFDLQSVAQLTERAVATAAAAAAAWLGADVFGFVAAALAGAVTGSLLVIVLAARVAAAQLGPGWFRQRGGLLREKLPGGLAFVASTNAGATLSMLSKESDALWLGWLRTPAEAGLYRLAYNLASLLFLPVSTLAQTVYPEAARLAAGSGWPALRALVARGTRWVTAYAVLLVALSTLLGRWAITLLYGPAFAPAAPALTVLLIGVGISSVAFWTRPVLLATGQAGYALLGAGVGAAVKIAGVLALVPRWGVIANAWTLTAAYAAGIGLISRRAVRTLRPVDVV